MYNSNTDKINPNNNNIAILGAGFLGLLCAKILNWISPDLPVTLIDRNKYKLDHNISDTHQNICLTENADWQNFIKENSAQFSHVIESCGSPDTFRYSIQLAKHAGTIVWMGNIFSDLEIPKAMISSILRKELNIKGTWNSNYDPDNPDCDWMDAIKLLSKGLKFENLISERISLEDLPSRMKQLYSHKSRESEFKAIKILVIPSMNTERSSI